jgi:hypothetical protein
VFRIVQKFGPLLRLLIIFNVNQLQEKRTACADAGTRARKPSSTTDSQTADWQSTTTI